MSPSAPVPTDDTFCSHCSRQVAQLWSWRGGTRCRAGHTPSPSSAPDGPSRGSVPIGTLTSQARTLQGFGKDVWTAGSRQVLRARPWATDSRPPAGPFAGVTACAWSLCRVSEAAHCVMGTDHVPLFMTELAGSRLMPGGHEHRSPG